MRSLINTILFACTLVSCSQADKEIQVPETFDARLVSQSIARQYCGAFRRCLNDVRSEHVLHESVCNDQLGHLIGQRLNRLSEAVDSGRIVYSPDGLRRCVTAISNASCREVDLETFEADCAAALYGTLPAGEPCSYDAECDGGFCPGDDTCSSQCRSLSTVGEPCGIDGDLQCAAGLDCNADDVCYPKDQARFLVGLGALCHVHQCQAGLRCVRIPEPTCLPFGLIYGKRSGQVCRAARDDEPEMGCGPGLVCSFPLAPMVDGDGICRPLPQAGERCHLTIGGSNAWCEPGYYCEGLDPIRGVLHGHCSRFPDLGAPCGQFYGSPRSCGPDARCRDGICVPRSLAGEECGTHRDCGQGLCRGGVCAIDCYEPGQQL